MLLMLYPRVHRRYTSLPILGPILDGFGTWLLQRGYATDCVREHFCAARRLTRILEQRRIHSLARLTRARLRACAPANRLDDMWVPEILAAEFRKFWPPRCPHLTLDSSRRQG
jgi:hypothetical protein